MVCCNSIWLIYLPATRRHPHAGQRERVTAGGRAVVERPTGPRSLPPASGRTTTGAIEAPGRVGAPGVDLAESLSSRVDDLSGRLDLIGADLTARASESVIRPDWAVGITNQELRAIAAHEGRNPYVPDWGARIDPIIIREAKQGRFQVPGQSPIEELRGEQARLRDQ